VSETTRDAAYDLLVSAYTRAQEKAREPLSPWTPAGFAMIARGALCSDEGRAALLGLFSRQELLDHLGATEVGWLWGGAVHTKQPDDAARLIYWLEGP